MNIQDQIALERHRSTCSWIPSYGFVGSLAQSISATKVCEVGVAYGYHAEHLLDNNPTLEYQGVDPYRAGYDPDDSFATDVAMLFKDAPQKAMDRLYETVNIKLTRFGGRANLLRRSSVEGASRFADGYFDVVYIDGDHTYEGVKADLVAWYSKVRPGGIFCGDDFNWKGVSEAVVEFMEQKGKKLIGHSYPNDPAPIKWSIKV